MIILPHESPTFSLDEMPTALSPIVLDSYPVFLGIGDDADFRFPNPLPHSAVSNPLGKRHIGGDRFAFARGHVGQRGVHRAGSLMPGDKLLIGTWTLVISYERLTRQTTSRCALSLGSHGKNGAQRSGPVSGCRALPAPPGLMGLRRDAAGNRHRGRAFGCSPCFRIWRGRSLPDSAPDLHSHAEGSPNSRNER